MVLSRIIILVFLMATPCCFSATGVVINELLASNSSGIRDEAGDADDWIELYNSTAAAVDLSAWSLSDDRDDPQKAVLPSGTTIPAQGFLLIWADGEPDQGALHLDFSLSNGGEWIGLFNPDEVLRDSLAFGPQLTDFSFGRYPDGSDTSFTRLLPTPGAANAPQFLYSCQVT
ncbi:MAG: lamin tail domain-containing protein, partial [bacterium]